MVYIIPYFMPIKIEHRRSHDKAHFQTNENRQLQKIPQFGSLSRFIGRLQGQTLTFS